MDDEEAAQAHVGKMIGEKYRLLRVLGAGGMGAVYEAEHLFTKRRVALKRMHQAIARSKHAAARFIREAQAPSTIGHPGIVQVLDGGMDGDDSLYLVLELLDGVSMNDAMEENVLPTSAVTQIGVELLEALAAAHAKGFIHRDIKPDNVFLANDGRGGVTVKLLDFGIASIVTSEGEPKLTKTGSVLGTPLYMSPEQAQGARIDTRSDLWSVGAMLYRALAGKAPYDGDTYNALIVSIVTQNHLPLSESRPDLPPSLLDVVERALRKSPADRFESAEQMSAALQSVELVSSQASLPPLSSLRPTAHEARTVEPFATAPHPVQHDASEQPAATRAERHVRRRDEARAAVPSSSVVHAQPHSPARARVPAWAFVVGLCLLLGVASFALRGRPVPARAASAQLPPVDVPVEAPAPARVAAASPSAQPLDIQSKKPLTPQAMQPTPEARAPKGLAPEAVAHVIAEHQSEMQRCLEDAVVAQMMAGAADPKPFRLDIALRIGPSGAMDGVEVQGEAPPDLSRCVRAHLLALRFPRADAPTSFRYPLVLTPTIVGP